MLAVRREDSSRLVLSNYKVNNVIDSVGGRFFSCAFTKKDGTDRKILCRRGVHKHLRGGTNNVVSSSNSYITVYDIQARGYRTINLATIKEVHANKLVYEVK